jgi:hypothetical protein
MRICGNPEWSRITENRSLRLMSRAGESPGFIHIY